MSHVIVQGRRLQALHHPAVGDAPTLVCLHEGLGSIALWRDFPAKLAAATGAGLLVYDRSGYGQSDPAPGRRGVDYLHREALEELPATLDALDVARPLLVGHSDGATIALIYAAAATARPPVAVIVEAPHSFVEDVTIAGIKAAVAAWTTTDLRAKLARRHRDADAVFRNWWEIWLDPAFRSWSIEALLPKITAPVLAIQGLDDAYGTPRQIEAIARAVQGPVETLLIPNCGHAPHREAEAEVLAAMTRFVAAVGKSALS